MKKRVTILPKVFRLILSCICLTIATLTTAQTTNTGTWDVCNLFYKVNNHYTAWMEVQARSQNLYTDFFYHQVKGGLFYNFSKTHNSILIGGGRYTTYNYSGNFKSPVTTDEVRIWEQLILNNVYSHINVEHRYRLEQRWINNVYRPCLRYRINPIFTINHEKLVPKTLFVSAYDEIFLGNNNPHFERNRYYLGMGYEFSNSFIFQLGLLNQTDYNSKGGQTDKNFIQTTLIFLTDKNTFKKGNKSSSLNE